MTDNEELRKKIIDSYDSQLKDIFTEDEVLAILDALRPPASTPLNTGLWPSAVLNTNEIIHPYNHSDNDMFKYHPESEPIYKVDPISISSATSSAMNTDDKCEN